MKEGVVFDVRGGEVCARCEISAWKRGGTKGSGGAYLNVVRKKIGMFLSVRVTPRCIGWRAGMESAEHRLACSTSPLK